MGKVEGGRGIWPEPPTGELKSNFVRLPVATSFTHSSQRVLRVEPDTKCYGML